MHTNSLFIASLIGFAAYFIAGGLMSAIPALRNVFLQYPSIYRPQAEMKRVMPLGMLAIFVSIVVFVYLYAVVVGNESNMRTGACFGFLIGIFAVCAFVMHNHVNLRIGWKLTLTQAVMYLLLWTITGTAIGCLYVPLVVYKI